jgi:hypothetical protein
MIREANNADGTPGPVSARRVSALWCFFIGAPGSALLAVLAVTRVAAAGTPIDKWAAALFIPCALFVAAGLLLYFFTTWADVKGLITAARGKEA